MRILFLSRWFPCPADNGSKIRVFNLLKQLAAQHEIVLISFATGRQPTAAIDALRTYCTEVHTITYRPFQPTRFSAIVGLLSSRPRSVVDTYNQEMKQCVCKVAVSFQPDLVLASEIDMAPYAILVRNAKRVLDELQLTVLYEAASHGKAGIAQLRRSLTWYKHIRYVAATLQQFDGCTVVSEKEYEQVNRIIKGGTRLAIVANGVDTRQMRSAIGEAIHNTLIYTGALSFDANLDAMHYFVQEIFPLIVARSPQTTIKITGSIQDVPSRELPVHPNLALTGYVTDLRSTIAASYLSVVPLRIGGGTRLKILESLALGTPVVTTSKGIEGLKIAHGEGVLVADTPATFAENVLKVQQDPILRQQLSEAGRAAVQAFDWQQIGESLRTFINEVTLSQPTRQDRQAA